MQTVQVAVIATLSEKTRRQLPKNWHNEGLLAENTFYLEWFAAGISDATLLFGPSEEASVEDEGFENNCLNSFCRSDTTGCRRS